MTEERSATIGKQRPDQAGGKRPAQRVGRPADEPAVAPSAAGGQLGSRNGSAVTTSTPGAPASVVATGGAATGGEPSAAALARSEERDRATGPRPEALARTPAKAGAVSAASVRARRARLVLSRVDPWSVMKLGFLLSLALGIIFLTAIAVLWTTLDALGVFDQVTKTAGDLTRGDSGGGLNLASFLALRRVMGAATILALINVALLTALSTLGAFLYNLATSLVGGLQVTLTEES